MNVESLKAKRQVSEDQFNSLQKSRDAAATEVTKYDVELDRLRGEYRAYTALIDDFEADPASTVFVEGEVIEKDKTLKKEKKNGQK